MKTKSKRIQKIINKALKDIVKIADGEFYESHPGMVLEYEDDDEDGTIMHVMVFQSEDDS